MIASVRARLWRLASEAFLRVPEQVRSTVFPFLQGYTQADIPAPLGASEPGAVLIGAANSAGQADAWARSLVASGVAQANSMEILAASGGFHYQADLAVPTLVAARSPKWGEAQLAAASTFAVVYVESARPLFGRAQRGSVARQISALQASGVEVRLLWHGSDIRSPRRNAQYEPASPFADTDSALTRTLQAQTDEAMALADALALPEYVSTPDLLRDRPHAHWVPVVVDTQLWAGAEFGPGETLRVLHAPSKRSLKGSEIALPILERLAAEGVIDLVVPTHVKHEDMPALVRSVDVVADQFTLGIYGVAAVEALAAGRLVVSHVAEDVRAAAAQRSGIDLPIIEATGSTLESVIRAIAADPSSYAPLAHAGLPFATALHDGRVSAATLRATPEGL